MKKTQRNGGSDKDSAPLLRRTPFLAAMTALALLAGPVAHAYNWTGYGYVEQIYVRHDGETTFRFSKKHNCAGADDDYFKVLAGHPAHDRLFALLQSAQLNAVRINVDFSCKAGATAAIVGTVKTEGLNK